jgi:hypothetical protein
MKQNYNPAYAKNITIHSRNNTIDPEIKKSETNGKYGS